MRNFPSDPVALLLFLPMMVVMYKASQFVMDRMPQEDGHEFEIAGTLLAVWMGIAGASGALMIGIKVALKI